MWRVTDWHNPDDRERAIAKKWADAEKLIAEQQAEIERLRGVMNLLADKLACHTGYPIPAEIREAEAAQRAGAESWDSIRCVYVDQNGRKVKSRPSGEEE